jgi:nucleoside 2-deoxyribosyltransferase
MLFYISGKITGEKNYKQIFQVAENELRERGHKVINPAKLDALSDLKYEQIMSIDFALIDTADAVLMLPNWKQSLGAVREYGYALAKNKEIWGVGK